MMKSEYLKTIKGLFRICRCYNVKEELLKVALLYFKRNFLICEL